MDIPVRFLPTQTIAPETFVIRQLVGEGLGPTAAAMNSLVIRGQEPVIVDTGMPINRDTWLEHAFELVDPADVRWVFLSHDDIDHTGALFEVIERCPSATVVTNWFSVERIGGEALLPLGRLRLVNPGESFTAGDRTFTAVVPPVFDSPTTRGLFDSATGVYWAGDAFAVPLPHEVDHVEELDADFYRESFLAAQRMISPWHQWLDPVKYQAHLDEVQALGASVVVGGHGVALRGGHITAAYDLLRELPVLPPADLLGQAELEALLALLTAVPA